MAKQEYNESYAAHWTHSWYINRDGYVRGVFCNKNGMVEVFASEPDNYIHLTAVCGQRYYHRKLSGVNTSELSLSRRASQFINDLIL